MKRTVLLGAIAAAIAVPALAAGLNSGLKPGQMVSPFHPRHIAGPLAGTTNCFPCTFGDRPQVQVWVNGDDAKNVTTLAKNLSKAMKTYQGKEFKALVVFVTTPSDVAAQEKAARTLANLPDTKGIGVALIDSKDDAVERYSINTANNIKNTVLVYKKWTVTNTFVNMTADDKGVATLNNAITTITR